MRFEVLRTVKFRGVRWLPGAAIEAGEAEMAPLVATGSVRAASASEDGATGAEAPAAGEDAPAPKKGGAKAPKKGRKAKK